ncbi:MAG: RHS repeat-associated core domain-containing protein, partial [Gaiellales bacterium]
LGSITNLTSQSGTLEWSYDYEPYGATAQATQNDPNAPTNPIQFTGQYNDPTTGLYNLRARQYNPTLGQFTSPDPAGQTTPNQQSTYLYANARPTVLTDPSGLEATDQGCGSLVEHLPGIGSAWCEGLQTLSPRWQGIIGATVTAGPEALLFAAPGAIELRLALRASNYAAKGAAAARSSIVASDGTRINGFTGHGIDRVIGDGARRAGVRPQALLDAIRNPKGIKEGVDDLGRPFKIYTGRDARVVVNPQTGRIVSVNPLSRTGANR